MLEHDRFATFILFTKSPQLLNWLITAAKCRNKFLKWPPDPGTIIIRPQERTCLLGRRWHFKLEKFDCFDVIFDFSACSRFKGYYYVIWKCFSARCWRFSNITGRITMCRMRIGCFRICASKWMIIGNKMRELRVNVTAIMRTPLSENTLGIVIKNDVPR